VPAAKSWALLPDPAMSSTSPVYSRAACTAWARYRSGFDLTTGLSSTLTSLATDLSVRVILFDSADPDFFIAHDDMTLGGDPDAVAALMERAPEGPHPFQALDEQLRHQPQVTIVQLAVWPGALAPSS
jgi:hypothetical protein